MKNFQLIKLSAKILLAITLLAWLILDGRLNFELVYKLFQSPHLLIIGFIFVVLQDALTALRWRSLFNSQKQLSLSPLQAFRLTWIGLYFNTFTPGTVSGDVLKIYYTKKELHKNLSFIFHSIALDRVIGLTALVYLGAMASLLIHSNTLLSDSKIGSLIMINFVLAVAIGIVFIILFFTPKRVKQLTLHLARRIPIIGKLIAKQLFYTWEVFKDKKMILLQSLGLSFCSQIACFIGFWILCSPELSTAGFSFLAFISLIPLGFIILALPLTPSGLGVGHVAFEGLFLIYGLEGGANYFNVFYIVQIMSNSLGVIPYINYRSN